MASDIQPGDLVQALGPEAACDLCVGLEEDGGLGRGKILRVDDVIADPCPALIFAHDACFCFSSCCFRKLNDEPDNAEMVERIRKCRPMKIGVDA